MNTYSKKLQLVRPEIIAEKLQVSRNTILNWARDGQIPAIRIGKIYRFSVSEVSKAINFDLGAAA
jgi:excisionase family DNA binding protein